jgi:hypothetical protein
MSEPTDRQRLAAILAADVAGFSLLMSADERATVEALDAGRRVFRTEIEASQGRVIDMAGDSVLAVFDSAIGAVSAAVAVQRIWPPNDMPRPRGAPGWRSSGTRHSSTRMPSSPRRALTPGSSTRRALRWRSASVRCRDLPCATSASFVRSDGQRIKSAS